MTRLNVEAQTRWTSAAPDEGASAATFGHVAMVMALSITNQDGVGVIEVRADEIRVGFQMRPPSDPPGDESFAAISDFRHLGPSFGGTGWYSCLVQPPEPSGWLQDEVFLCVTVRHAADRGQTLLLARYHQFA